MSSLIKTLPNSVSKRSPSHMNPQRSKRPSADGVEQVHAEPLDS